MLVYRLYLVWFTIGCILVGFSLIPPWLEWANSVFLILAGLIAVRYAMHAFGNGKGLLISIFIWIVTFSVEGLSAYFNIFFGNYDYTDRFPPLLFGVPIGIGFAWIVMVMAGHALTIRLKHRFSRAFFAALYVVLLDLILDPVAFVAKQYWIWEDNSAYYGIPASNFIGWFVVAFILQLLLPRTRKNEPSVNMIKQMRIVFWTIVILFLWIAILSKLYLAFFVGVIGFLLLQFIRGAANDSQKI
ncbi:MULTISPECIES: carotenoid biosynthesis protein [Kurthia]|uniref:carotenoid biosynthesis protein n=1 Tax=Kurthia TaxID=1649 RepID=UPI00301A5FF3